MFLRLSLALALGATSVTAQAPSPAALAQRLDSIAGAAVRAGNVAGMAVAVVKDRDTVLLKGYGFAKATGLVMGGGGRPLEGTRK